MIDGIIAAVAAAALFMALRNIRALQRRRDPAARRAKLTLLGVAFGTMLLLVPYFMSPWIGAALANWIAVACGATTVGLLLASEYVK